MGVNCGHGHDLLFVWFPILSDFIGMPHRQFLKKIMDNTCIQSIALSDNFICYGWCNNISTLYGTPHRFVFVVVYFIVDDGLSRLGTGFVLKKRIDIVIHLFVDDGLSCLEMDFG